MISDDPVTVSGAFSGRGGKRVVAMTMQDNFPHSIQSKRTTMVGGLPVDECDGSFLLSPS
ncbi:hypothetical protein [Diaphorobacter caeni]|uniref:hypothetical protein n=1 Tax=Diaphorobacter caeni TaxID=2784387 RepID=UPI001890765F|nr:hypothetical protein [Diaphorobacter caeni]MBF5003227.1 hypothetical protein [Diaphorobacter caeni]